VVEWVEMKIAPLLTYFAFAQVEKQQSKRGSRHANDVGCRLAYTPLPLVLHRVPIHHHFLGQLLERIILAVKRGDDKSTRVGKTTCFPSRRGSASCCAARRSLGSPSESVQLALALVSVGKHTVFASFTPCCCAAVRSPQLASASVPLHARHERVVQLRRLFTLNVLFVPLRA